MKKKNIKIIGILLFKNEDIFLKKCINSVIDFVDKLILLDNYSTDNSIKIIKEISKVNKEKIYYKKIKKISESHKFIQNYAGKKVWIMKIDADEIYDKKKLKSFKKNIYRGHLDNYWIIKASMLNILNYDLKTKKASGFFSPPSQNSSQIYNFYLIKYWRNCRIERLHYGQIKFKKQNYNKIYIEKNWNNASFRCLHFCFEKRSSISNNFLKINKAPFEISDKTRIFKSQIKYFFILMLSLLSLRRNLIGLIKILLMKKFFGFRKIEQYSRGNLITKISISDIYK